MKVLVTEDMMNDRKAVDIRIEEIADVSFDMSESGSYVDIDDIEGRLIVDYEVNHGAIRDEIERAREPNVTDRLNMFFEEWSIDERETNKLEIQYGSLQMRGTEPLDQMQDHLPLSATLRTDKFEQTSPEDLKRELRQEHQYTVSYDDLEEDIIAYLEREGVNTDQVSLGAPVHLQARAEPIADDEQDLYGTKFTVSIENQVPRRLDPSRLRVAMEPGIGREVTTLDGTEGSYNPAEEEFVFEVSEIPPSTGQKPTVGELEFVVPRSAGADLETLSGTATLNTTQPFTNYLPEAVFDAGGRKLYDQGRNNNPTYATVQSTCSIEADFETPTRDIMIGETAQVEKKISIEGVTPPRAESEIESVLRQRGIDASGGVSEQGSELREDAEVTQFSGTFSGGSVVVGDTRINVEVSVNGERRTGESATERSSGEELPAKRRNVSFDYGRTGVTIRGRGADAQKVDSYLSDLRDELRLELESIAKEA
jgi:hypothetical protein